MTKTETEDTVECEGRPAPLETWGVWCEVWGGVTGAREAWLKNDGKIAAFATREEAETEARHLNDKMASSRSRASFRYTARQQS